MERIGLEMEPTVREIFRNLTTAQGTRAALDREELLSALPDRAAAEAVLTKLIDARLLTSWETEAAEGQPARHRIEIVHESLLSAWPRLVRWQTQDADGAQLRDQLRQAAHLWEERGKADDLLWTGSSYLDYRVWRGRYPGKLSSLEEDFSGSMKALAERTRRRRRAAVGSVLVALLVGRASWRCSGAGARRPEGGPRRASCWRWPSSRSTRTPPRRWRTSRRAWSSTTRRRPGSSPCASCRAPRSRACCTVSRQPAFSPNGEWLAVVQDEKILLLNQDGREPVTISPGELSPGTFRALAFGPDSKVLSVGFRDELRLLSVPDGREIRHVKYQEAIDDWSCPQAAGSHEERGQPLDVLQAALGRRGAAADRDAGALLASGRRRFRRDFTAWPTRSAESSI